MRWTLIILAALALLTLLPAISHAGVVINEVELNPPGDEMGHKAPARAWIELYNDDSAADIGGWSLNASGGRYLKLPEGKIIPELDYYVIVVDPQWLGYGEILVLANETGAEVDRTPALSDTKDNDLAWTRDPDGRDTDSTDDWKFLPSSSGF